MSNRQTHSHRQSVMMAYSGMTAALSVVLMLLGGIIPIMTYVSPLLCGVLLLPILLEFGKQYAWICWGVTALIVLLIGADREAAFFYLFFGYYPIIKWRLDQIKSKRLCLLAKASLFSLLTVALYALLGFVLHLDVVTQEFAEMGVWMTVGFLVVLVFCLLLYDRLLFPLCILYENRIKPKMKFIR